MLKRRASQLDAEIRPSVAHKVHQNFAKNIWSCPPSLSVSLSLSLPLSLYLSFARYVCALVCGLVHVP